MKKLLVVMALTVACLAVASPAFAQRDPFDPVIDPNAATTTTTAPTGSDTGTVGDPTVQPGGNGEVLSNTGSDPSPWLVVAYGLIVIGGMAVIYAKLHTPQPIRR